MAHKTGASLVNIVLRNGTGQLDSIYLAVGIVLHKYNLVHVCELYILKHRLNIMDQLDSVFNCNSYTINWSGQSRIEIWPYPWRPRASGAHCTPGKNLSLQHTNCGSHLEELQQYKSTSRRSQKMVVILTSSTASKFEAGCSTVCIGVYVIH